MRKYKTNKMTNELSQCCWLRVRRVTRTNMCQRDTQGSRRGRLHNWKISGEIARGIIQLGAEMRDGRPSLKTAHQMGQSPVTVISHTPYAKPAIRYKLHTISAVLQSKLRETFPITGFPNAIRVKVFLRIKLLKSE